MLTDADWITQEHRRRRRKYTGPARIVDQNAPPPPRPDELTMVTISPRSYERSYIASVAPLLFRCDQPVIPVFASGPE
jgi:hypothetical protein